MEFSDVVKGRRSVRRFKSDRIPKEKLEKLLENAQWAVSAMNRQDWYFVVLQGEPRDGILEILARAFDGMKAKLKKAFADNPDYIEEMRKSFSTFGGSPCYYSGLCGNASYR